MSAMTTSFHSGIQRERCSICVPSRKVLVAYRQMANSSSTSISYFLNLRVLPVTSFIGHLCCGGPPTPHRAIEELQGHVQCGQKVSSSSGVQADLRPEIQPPGSELCQSTLQAAQEKAKLPAKGSTSRESLLNAEDQPPPG